MHQFSGFISVLMVFALIYLSVSRLARFQKATRGSKWRPRISSLSFRGMLDLYLNWVSVDSFSTLSSAFC
jgi:hypothetical protein